MLFLLSLAVALTTPAAAFTYKGYNATAATWKPCSVPGVAFPSNTGNLTCATFQVPLDWGNPTATKRIDIRVWRFLRTDAPSVGALWFLAGGPGNPGMGSVGTYKKMRDRADALQLNFSYDMYAYDHRGISGSTPLNCSTAMAEDSPGGEWITVEEYPRCVVDLLSIYTHRELAMFSTTNAAWDVRFVSTWEQSQRQQQNYKVAVLGESYGTYLALRMLQLEGQDSRPHLIDFSILDGVVAPDLYSYMTQTGTFTSALRTLCSACAEDYGGCRKALGPAPCQTMLKVKRLLETGHCAEAGFAAADFVSFNGRVLSLLGSPLLPLVLTRRLLRCNPEDVVIVKQRLRSLGASVATSLNAAFTPSRTGGNQALLFNVVYSENQGLSDNPYPYLKNVGMDIDADALGWFSPAQNFTAAQAVWPTYDDPLSNLYPSNISSPILMMNGGLDGNTPVAYAFHAQQRLAARTNPAVVPPRLVIFSPGKHVIMLQEQVKHSGVKCVVMFLNNPANPALNTCMDEVSISTIIQDPVKYATATEIAFAGGANIVANKTLLWALDATHTTSSAAGHGGTDCGKTTVTEETTVTDGSRESVLFGELYAAALAAGISTFVVALATLCVWKRMRYKENGGIGKDHPNPIMEMIESY
jgi:pimeloyl-ACP methyl ester carboxylesterase